MRKTLREKAVILFGKNTLIRKTMKDFIEKSIENGDFESSKIESLLPSIRKNVGLVFTNEEILPIKEVIESFSEKGSAKVGSIAPSDVFIESGPTGLEPTQTQFLSALNISTKISRGQIEILSRVHLIKSGDKIGSSQCEILKRLKIEPFCYRAEVKGVYDDGVYIPISLPTVNDVLKSINEGIKRVASISLEIGFPLFEKNISFNSPSPSKHVRCGCGNQEEDDLKDLFEEEKEEEEDKESSEFGGLFSSED